MAKTLHVRTYGSDAGRGDHALPVSDDFRLPQPDAKDWFTFTGKDAVLRIHGANIESMTVMSGK